MAERLAILAVLALALAVGWTGLRLWLAARQRQLAAERPLLGIVPPGRPAVVAFSVPGCAACRAQQAPALERLRAHQGETAAVLSLLATEHPALVERLGILTVPATVVLDAAGAVRRVNLGFTDATQLAAQLRAASAASTHLREQ